jgi:hypothetical protein
MEHGDRVHGDGSGHVIIVIKLRLRKEERENKNQVLIKAKVSNRFLFWHSRHQEGVSVFRIDSRTIKRENLWLSDYRVPLHDMILAYAFRDLVC